MMFYVLCFLIACFFSGAETANRAPPPPRTGWVMCETPGIVRPTGDRFPRSLPEIQVQAAPDIPRQHGRTLKSLRAGHQEAYTVQASPAAAGKDPLRLCAVHTVIICVKQDHTSSLSRYILCQPHPVRKMYEAGTGDSAVNIMPTDSTLYQSALSHPYI